MRSARWITPLVALTPLLAVGLPAVATAQSVSVNRGGEVSVVDVGDDDLWEKQNLWEEKNVREEKSEVFPEAPRVVFVEVVVVNAVVVNVEAFPETAWALLSPWEKSGIEVHDRGGDPSRIVTHSGSAAPHASEMRVHGIFGERSNPSAIRTLPFRGDESRIKVHGMGSRGPSRIRVHGVGR